MRWLLLLQDFNMTILDKPRRFNKVANFLSRIKQEEGDRAPVQDEFTDENLFSISIKIHWFADIANYLATSEIPLGFTLKKKKRLIRESAPFKWINGILFCCGPNLVLRRCVRADETYSILRACHDDPSRGYYSAKRTSHKILGVGYYWPSMHRDVKNYVRHCDECQRVGRPTNSIEIPLQPQVALKMGVIFYWAHRSFLSRERIHVSLH